MHPPNSTPLTEDSFENQLRNTPQRPAPIEWREQILTVATATQRFQASPLPNGASIKGTKRSLWDLVARRIPEGWLGFATVWVLIFASGEFDSWLNGTPSRSGISSTIPLRAVDFGKYRNELLRVAELLPEVGPEERTPPIMRPHSQRDKLPQPFGGSASVFEVVPAAILVLPVGQESALPLLRSFAKRRLLSWA